MFLSSKRALVKSAAPGTKRALVKANIKPSKSGRRKQIGRSGIERRALYMD